MCFISQHMDQKDNLEKDVALYSRQKPECVYHFITTFAIISKSDKMSPKKNKFGKLILFSNYVY